MAQEVVVRRRPGDDRHQLLQDPVLLAERERISRRGVETVEADNDVGPVVMRRQRHLDLGDDSVGAIGVHRLVQILPGKLERSRRCLHRHEAKAQHIAKIA